MIDFESASWRDLYPFESNFFDIDGFRYHYLDEFDSAVGGGASLEFAALEAATSAAAGPIRPPDSPPTLLFVHGNPTWSFHWRRLILALRGQYRCIAPDHLGCGGSDLQPRPLRLADHIDNLVRLVESLDLRQVTLVAQDWGGAIGLGAALRAVGRFDRIALFNTGAFPPWFIPWRIRVCRWPVVGRLAVQGGNAFSLAALRMTLSRSARLDPRVAHAYLAPHRDWRHRGAVYQFVQDIPLSAGHPTWQTLADIESQLPALASLPIQLIWGMRDWCFTPACLDKFCGIWPAAEIHRLADVGHWVLEDAPGEAQSILGGWLDATLPVAHGSMSP